MSARKTERLLAILALWNDGLPAAEIGARVGLPRMSVNRIVWAARRAGYAVARIAEAERARRQADSRRASSKRLRSLAARGIAARTPDAASGLPSAGKRV